MVFGNLRKVWNNLETWKKEKHDSLVGKMQEGAGIFKGSFMLCLEKSCSWRQGNWLKDAANKVGASVQCP